MAKWVVFGGGAVGFHCHHARTVGLLKVANAFHFVQHLPKTRWFQKTSRPPQTSQHHSWSAVEAKTFPCGLLAIFLILFCLFTKESTGDIRLLYLLLPPLACARQSSVMLPATLAASSTSRTPSMPLLSLLSAPQCRVYLVFVFYFIFWIFFLPLFLLMRIDRRLRQDYCAHLNHGKKRNIAYNILCYDIMPTSYQIQSVFFKTRYTYKHTQMNMYYTYNTY